MTLSTLTLAEAAALVPMTPDRLSHWAELGYVPGATHAGKRKHWAFNRDVFTAGLIPLQVMLADVERRGTIDGTRRNPATGLPFVACEVPPLSVEVSDAVRLLPTVDEALANPPMCRTPWLLVFALSLVSFVLGMIVR